MTLLEKIHAGQSVRSAAESLGMGYRADWGKIKNTEKVLEVALIEKKKRGSKPDSASPQTASP